MFDLIIIGGGPCGITAGIYGIRSGLKTLVIEKSNVGGQVINTYEIKNFPTYVNIDGATFCAKLYEQASYNNLEIKNEEVISVNLKGDVKIINTQTNSYSAKSVIIASGTVPRNLGLENETNLVGKGISYCALCDGNFFKNQTVAVIGGGDSAMEDAIILSGICKKVYVINRSEKLKAQVVLQNALNENIKQKGNIEIIYNAFVNKIFGDKFLTGVELEFKNGEKQNLEINGMFLAIGKLPDTKIYSEQVSLDKNGYILVDDKLQTSLKGVYAGGDCIQKTIRQIITACNDGAICATNANLYLKGE